MSGEVKTSAVILAGGGARRFGTDKARAQWRGRRLLDHVISALDLCSNETILVVGPDSTGADWPVTKVVCDDAELPAGPMRGLVAGLSACRSEWAWVIACDTPQIQPALLMALREAASPQDIAVVPYWQGRPQPLVACWSVQSAAQLADLAASGVRSPSAALDTLPHLRFDETLCRSFDPDGLSFLNVNTPEDMNRLR